MRRIALFVQLVARLAASLIVGLFLTGLAAFVLWMVILNLTRHGFSAGRLIVAVLFALITVGTLIMTAVLVRSSWTANSSA